MGNYESYEDWKNKYYDQYSQWMTAAGLPVMAQSTAWDKKYGLDWGDTNNGKDLNMEASSQKWQNEAKPAILDEYNQAQKQYSQITGTPITSLSANDIDIDTIGQKINDLKTNTATAFKSQTDQLQSAIDSGNTTLAKELSDKISGYDLTGTGLAFDADKYNTKIDTAVADNTYKPSQDILDVEAEFKNILANPTTLDPAKIQAWQDSLNKDNATNDAAATTRLNAQFSALGDLGSSANRQAIAQNDAATQLGRSAQAQGLAAQDQSAQWTQETAALQGLMNTGSYEDQLRLIPLQQQWQNYLANQNNSFTQENLGLQNQYTQANTYLQSDLANKNSQNLMNLYNQSKPTTQWWQPILNAGLTAAGYAIGGPVAGIAAGGLSSAFNSPSNNDSSAANSLYNQGSNLNAEGYRLPGYSNS